MIKSHRQNISLGRNCEVAFALQKCNQKIKSSLLNWSAIGSDNALFSIINNPQIVFSGGATLRSRNLFRCEVTKALWHGKATFDHHEGLDPDDPDVLESLSELKSRTSYLANKLATQLAGQSINAYVKPPLNLSSGPTFAVKLREVIDRIYPTNDVRLFAVSEGNGYSCEKSNDYDKLYLCSISSYTHDGSAASFDDASLSQWRNIFDHASII